MYNDDDDDNDDDNDDVFKIPEFPDQTNINKKNPAYMYMIVDTTTNASYYGFTIEKVNKTINKYKKKCKIWKEGVDAGCYCYYEDYYPIFEVFKNNTYKVDTKLVFYDQKEELIQFIKYIIKIDPLCVNCNFNLENKNKMEIKAKEERENFYAKKNKENI